MDYPPIIWSHIDPLGADLVKKLLVVDVSKRLTVAEALRHPWCVRGLNLLKAQGGALGEMATKELEDQEMEKEKEKEKEKALLEGGFIKVKDGGHKGDDDDADDECGGFIREDENDDDDDDDFMPDEKRMKL